MDRPILFQYGGEETDLELTKYNYKFEFISARFTEFDDDHIKLLDLRKENE
jgi:hypothetical protein